MLYSEERHEACAPREWDADCAASMIATIVADTESRFSPDTFWPMHPLDADDGDTRPAYPLYHGAAGVIWALHYLRDVGAARLKRSYAPHLYAVLSLDREWLAAEKFDAPAAYLMGETSILMQLYGDAASPDIAEPLAERIAALIERNETNPAREVMWGAPGTMLAALFMHERTGQSRWGELFRRSARTLWSQLLWSSEHECFYWTQDLYGASHTFIDAVHGFVGTASPLIRGRHLLDEREWAEWQGCIANTVRRCATIEHGLVNWRSRLTQPQGRDARMLMQFCHGAPGFVVTLADFPGDALDDLLLAGGEATWCAGPLTKGSNVCHGTGGNGYAFLKLYERTGDAMWLARARQFAMHAIEQTQAHAARYGQMRYSLWTGDPGFAVFLWDCINARARFPTLDAFFTR
jgi:lantibiotic modifying enzyme